MTTTTTKVRAVFMTALMVMSVFAMVPLSASAQSANDASVTSQHTIDLSQSSTNLDGITQTITLSSVSANSQDTVLIDVSETTDANIEVDSASASGGNGNTDTTDYHAHNDTVTVNFSGSTNNNDVTVDLTLDASSDDVEEDSRIRHQISLGSNSYTAAYKTIEIPSTTVGSSTGSVTAYAGETLTFQEGKDTVITIYEPDGDSGWDSIDRFSTSPGDAVDFDTTELEGDYVVTYDDQEPDNNPGTVAGDETSLTIDELNMNVEADDLNVTTEDNITAEISAAAFGEDFYAELYEEGADFEDDNPLRRVVDSFDGTGDANVDLGNVSSLEDGSAGDYVVRAVHNNTEIEDTSDTINVTAAGDADVDFEDSSTLYQERGDVAEFTVDLQNTDEAYVEIGGQSSNFLANFTVTDGDDDDSNVTVSVNTMTTKGAQNVGKFISVSDTDSFSVDNNGMASSHGDQGIYTGDPLTPVGATNGNALTSPISAGGSYNLVVATEDDERDAKKILSVDRPSVDGVNTWVYEGSLPDSDETAELLDGVSSTDTIAQGDAVVVEAQVSGIHGYLNDSIEAPFGYGDRSGPDTINNENSNVFLNVTETNTGPNAVATAYDYDDVDTAYYDAENNTVYYAFQTGNNGLSADANYNAEMKVFKGNDAYTSTQNASADFEVAEQNIEITGLNS
ncbi:DUF7827 domain-containing protein, partial [Halorussus marinus]|uniref:DUF7827 domain-containing protein n=1 Tax=Halorussus marinus TaxID=2505976 RepID=UPI00106E1E4D